MAQIIRLYDSPADATAAVAELKSYRFDSDSVQVIHPTGDNTNEPASGEHDAAGMEHTLRELGLSHSDAGKYAGLIHAGATLVSVNASFGDGSRAEYILDGHNPTHSVAAGHSYSGAEFHDPAPLSHALGLKLLINNPAPLSSMFGFAILSNKQNSSTQLSPDPAPLSHATKMPLLSNSPAPLSSIVHLPVLSRNPAPLSSVTGAKVLSDDPAPFSKALGWNTLASEPAPLSKLFGLPVLLNANR